MTSGKVLDLETDPRVLLHTSRIFTTFFSSAPLLLGLGGLAIIWRTIFVGVTSAQVSQAVPSVVIWNIILNLTMVGVLAQYLGRQPGARSTIPAVAHQGAVNRLSKYLGTSPPTVLLHKNYRKATADVVARGAGGRQVLVLGLFAHTRWLEDNRLRDGLLAHELVHVASKDARTYYWVKAMNIVSGTCLLLFAYFFFTNGDGVSAVLVYSGRVASLALLTTLAARSFARYREHVADVVGASILPDRSVMSHALTFARARSALVQIIGTHPSRRARRAVVFNPELILQRSRFSFFICGVAWGFLASAAYYFATAFWVSDGSVGLARAAWAGSLLTAALAGVLWCRALLELITFQTHSLTLALRRLVYLLFGYSIGQMFVNPNVALPGWEGLVWGLSLCLCAAFLLGIVLTAAIFAVICFDRDWPLGVSYVAAGFAAFLVVTGQSYLTTLIFQAGVS